MKIYLDIETIPSQLPGAREHAAAKVKPPAALKKRESIAAWWDSESAAAIEDAYRGQAFNALHGEIISIAITNDHDHEWVACRKQGESEAELLTAFGQVVHGWLQEQSETGPDGRSWPVGEPWFVGHNAAFDLGFVWRRCAVLGVRLPFKLPKPTDRVGQHYGCTMAEWAGIGYQKTVSLDGLCKAFGVPTSKGDLDGSQVFNAWLAGEYDRIATYNLKDTKACQTVWHRMQVVGK